MIMMGRIMLLALLSAYFWSFILELLRVHQLVPLHELCHWLILLKMILFPKFYICAMYASLLKSLFTEFTTCNIPLLF